MIEEIKEQIRQVVLQRDIWSNRVSVLDEVERKVFKVCHIIPTAEPEMVALMSKIRKLSKEARAKTDVYQNEIHILKEQMEAVRL